MGIKESHGPVTMSLVTGPVIWLPSLHHGSIDATVVMALLVRIVS